ncbi:FUSC family protein [Anaerobacillus sp. MEB173]|uniref:FUSC family protein n=1 Tax=Anaerobacillus sp. MEB173 TaxID=3383345 RepID=UPI003F934C58
MKTRNVIGRRVIKTGLAVLITAWICHFFQLPAMFAVITAIVTTEPTAADSLKKGVIRLPAAAIGAALALLFDFIIGPSALTYSLVAMITIVICHRLNFDNGTLVATLTAVAMIPGTSDGFMVEFITRLSGTSIGIIVSTLVNFLVLPPKFAPIIYYKVDHLYDKTAETLENHISFRDLDHFDEQLLHYRELSQEIDKTFQLSIFQEEEWKYRRHNQHEKRSFEFIQKKLNHLQKVIFHLGKLCYLQLPNQNFSDYEKQVLSKVIQSISAILQDPLHQIQPEHHKIMEQFYETFTSKSTFSPKSFSVNPHAVVLYELLSLNEIIIELEGITTIEHQFSFENQEYPQYIFSKRFQYD